MNKKAVSYFEEWPEMYFIILFIAGFVLVVSANNVWFTYLFILICGALAGRYLYQKKGKFPVPHYIIILGFFTGFVFAMIITKKADWRLGSILFVLSGIFVHYLHDKKYIQD
jgi:4-hydroxybenzoate polyprenyltransferase